MMTDQMPFSAKLACLPIALFAFSMAFGAPSVRAQSDANAPSWREIAVDPIMNAVHSVEQRLASIEATVALFAGSFTTQQLNTRQLCVSDETGAQTCITKAQLDALLAKMAHAAAAEPPAAVIDDDEDETAVANEPAIEGTGSEEEFSAQSEPTPSEATVVTALEPAANEGVSSDQEPATTGSVTSQPSHHALVSHPEVEISSPDTASSVECIPSMSRRLIWGCRRP
jgi:hypothetical protein